VTVSGEVRFPGSYRIFQGERLSSVLKRAGGFTDKAFPPGLVLIRESVKQTQQTEIQKFVAAQKQKLLAESAALTAGGLQPDQAKTEQATLNTQMQFLDQLATRLAPGRVVVKVFSLEQLEGTTDDVLLEPRDQITIPQHPTTVTVLGAVRNATSVVYREGVGLDDYIWQAGGMMSEADKGEVYIVHADGSTESTWLKFKQMHQGDIIVVPQKIEAKTRPLPMWQAVASILASFATAAMAFVVIGAIR
jgi:protein involved in polysaccharide export with SLBB domain